MRTLRKDTDAMAVSSSFDPESLKGLAVPTVADLNLLVYGLAVPTVGELEAMCGLAGSVTNTLPAGPSMILCPKCRSRSYESYTRGGITYWKCSNCGYDTGKR